MRANVFMRRYVVSRNNRIRSIASSACGGNSLRRRHAFLTPTQSERGEQRHQGRPDCRGKTQVHWGQVHIAHGHMRSRHAAIARHAGGGGGGCHCGSTCCLSTCRRHTARLRGLRRLAADAVLLQFHQHPALQRQQLLETGNLSRSLRHRRGCGRRGRQRRRCTRRRRASRRLDSARPDVRATCLRWRQRGSRHR